MPVITRLQALNTALDAYIEAILGPNLSEEFMVYINRVYLTNKNRERREAGILPISVGSLSRNYRVRFYQLTVGDTPTNAKVVEDWLEERAERIAILRDMRNELINRYVAEQ